MKLLDKEQILALSQSEAQKYLKKIEKYYKVDTSILEYNTEEIRVNFDLIVNTLLWLEDHIEQISLNARMDAMRDQRYGTVAEKSQT